MAPKKPTPKKPPANRAKTGRWQPGTSGNSSGRPRRSSIRDFFNEPVADGSTRLESVLKAMYEVAVDRKHRDCFKAIELCAAYACGRPVSALEVSGIDGAPIEVNGREELRLLTSEKQTQRLADLITLAKQRQAKSAADAE